MKRPIVIFLTAAAQKTDKVKAGECGGDDFLAKPFEISDLVQKVRDYLK